MTEKPVIEMKGVSKIYRIGGEEVRALDNASLTISRVNLWLLSVRAARDNPH